MAYRFPDIPQTHDDYFFNHLTACVNQGHAPGQLWYPNGVAIDIDTNEIYVAEGCFYSKGNPINIARVSIFSETGEFLNTFSHPDMKKPWGIAIHRDNIYITDKEEHFVFHFKVEAEYHLVARLGGRGSDIGQFNEPRQLAVSTDGDVFVADSNNNRVQIFDVNLHYQRQITHHSMRGPIDVKLTSKEVFVLCKSSPYVKVFSYTGDLIRSLITSFEIGMLFITPSFFCLDTDGNLIFCNHSRNHIKVFSKEGILLHTLGKVDDKAERFYYPSGLALINNLKLVVVSMDINYCLEIFSS